MDRLRLESGVEEAEVEGRARERMVRASREIGSMLGDEGRNRVMRKDVWKMSIAEVARTG